MGWVSSNLSDEAAVAQVVADRQAKGQSDFLPHYLQRIWVVGCAFRDDQGFQVRCLGEGYGITDADESQRLRQFFAVIERYTPQLVSWNGSGFDAPVLHHRSLLRGVSAPRYWETGDDDRDFKYNNYLSRYHTRHLDLMDVLTNYSGRGGAPLDGMSQLCGLPGKLGEEGSQVWASCLQGRHEEVAAYCETDVVNTYLLYQRFRLMRAEIHADQLASEYQLVRQTLERYIGDSKAPLKGAHWQKFLAAWSD